MEKQSQISPSKEGVNNLSAICKNSREVFVLTFFPVFATSVNPTDRSSLSDAFCLPPPIFIRISPNAFVLLLVIIFQLKPAIGLDFDKSDPSVSLLQNRISNNFSKKYCNAIQNGLSKDEAMKSAIVKTENIISFSYNPQKKWIEKSDLANQISLQVVNDCGWSFGLIGKEGVDYFKSYFLEIYEKTTPDKNFSR